MKSPNKGELYQIALNHSPDIDFKDFMKNYRKYVVEPHSFLLNGTTLPSNNLFKVFKKIF